MSKLTTTEVASLTGISAATLRRWCSQKKIKGAKKEGRDWFIPSEVVKDLPKPLPEGKRSPAYRKALPE